MQQDNSNIFKFENEKSKKKKEGEVGGEWAMERWLELL